MRQLKQVTLATELHAVRSEIAARKAELKELEKRDDELSGNLLSLLQQQGVKSVKLDDGTIYTKVKGRTTLSVVDEAKAIEWCAANNSLKPDASKAWKILKLLGHSDAIPEGFEKKISAEHLRVGGGDDKEED